MSSEKKNPLFDNDALPKFTAIQPSHLTPAVETLLPQVQAAFEELEKKLEESEDVQYDDILPVMERMEHAVDYAWGIARHLNKVKDTKELRDAIDKHQADIVKTFSKFQQSKPLYDALLALKWPSSSDPPSYEVLQQQRAVELSLLGMKLGGVGLEGAAKERFNEIKARQAQLSTKFSSNLLDETKAFGYEITDATQVEGVPESARSMWAKAYITHYKSENPDAPQKEMDAEKGPWRITLDIPSYLACLKHVRVRSIREAVYMARIQRASSGEEKNNIPIIFEQLQLRSELSKLLGFENYAQLSLAKKMAPSVDDVSKLSELILEKALPAAEKELAEITALARSKGGDEYSKAALPELKPWDTSYWTERLKESKFELKEEETRPYFALPEVLKGMFLLIGRLFNVKIVEAADDDGKAEVWHPDVKFFNVYDGEERIASFYLDPYSRPEEKSGGAWMNPAFGKSKAIHRMVPVAYLVCNGSPPVGNKPSLMTFREVETLFHETGHGLQHMLTTACVGEVSGISGIEWDAVELPSQFMENWCYDRPTVYGFAKHWETGDPMPNSMFEKLQQQRTFNAGMMACRQLLFGQLDMELHSNYDANKGASGEGESLFDAHRRLAKKFTPYALPVPEDRFLCAFSHLFAGGYAAGYYSYKWAEVMSADAFSAFEDVGLDNEEQIKQVGRKFRQTVLSLGGSKKAMEVFKEFRGREPNPEALLRHTGLC